MLVKDTMMKSRVVLLYPMIVCFMMKRNELEHHISCLPQYILRLFGKKRQGS